MGRGRGGVPDKVSMELYDEQDSRSQKNASRILTDALVVGFDSRYTRFIFQPIFHSGFIRLRRAWGWVMIPRFSNCNTLDVHAWTVLLPATPCMCPFSLAVVCYRTRRKIYCPIFNQRSASPPLRTKSLHRQERMEP